MYATGMRVSELINLKMNNLNMDVGFVKCFGKGGKERIIPFGKKAKESIARYLDKSRQAFLKKKISNFLLMLYITEYLNKCKQLWLYIVNT